MNEVILCDQRESAGGRQCDIWKHTERKGLTDSMAPDILKLGM